MTKRVFLASAGLLCALIVPFPSARGAEQPEPRRAPSPVQPIAPASTPRERPPVPPGMLSDRVVAYAIEAALDTDAKTVTASERITWRNPSEVPVGELQFHLYLNAFKDKGSTFMKESGGQLREDFMPEGKFGKVDITALTTDDGKDLLPTLEFIHPDDDNDADRTVARVPLPQAVAPGQSVTVRVEFVDKLPGVFARTGYKDNFFLVAQWFPKLGVFEPRGMRGRQEPGWNCHQFHANSEFYADFGTFDVSVTTPERFVVGATGQLVSETKAGAVVTRTYHQEDVHDFAWTADDNYVVGKRTYTDPGFEPVEVTALVQPEHRALLDRHLDDAVASLRWFNHEIGPYPYKVLTVVDPEDGAGGAGGMEYPTFITAGVDDVLGTLPAADDPLLEIVIFHEFGHQYWYGMVASNEFEEPWLDEGINSYTETRGMKETWPDSRNVTLGFAGVHLAKVPFSLPGTDRAERFAALPHFAKAGPLINNSWSFKGNYSYGVNTYYRTAAALQTLSAVVGDETMSRIMRTYFERWKFRHPTSQDFFDVASEVSGQDLEWFFTEFFREPRALDYGVQSVIKRDGNTEVILERLGDAILPVKAVATLEDGSQVQLDWEGTDGQKVFQVPGVAVRVEIDPERRVHLDANLTNNSWVASADRFGPLRVASQVALLFENLLVTLTRAI